jgi:PQQ-dependent dehydrogenase (methanol/ethanol family)
MSQDESKSTDVNTVVKDTGHGAYRVYDSPEEPVLVQNDIERIPKGDVTQEMLSNSGTDPESWLMFGKNYEMHRHSAADIITPENVGDIQLEYEMQVGANSSMQGTPLIVPGDPPIMYQANGPCHVKAIDAREGEVLWRYSHPVPNDVILCCDDNKRGVAVWKDKVYMPTLDCGIQALNRYTGEREWYTNNEKPEKGYSLTSPPIIHDGKLYVGASGGEFGVKGFHVCLDAETGEEIWRNYTSPEEEWVGESSERYGGTSWMTPTIDEERGQLYFNVGNPSPDFNGLVRPGPNRNTCSTICTDMETGETQWAHQESPHDIWDYDTANPRILIRDAKIDHLDYEGDIVYNAGKTSWAYTMDPDSGQLKVRSEPLTQQVNMYSMLPHAEEERQYVFLPGVLGGVDWQPPTYSHATGLVYHKALNAPMEAWWLEEEYEEGEAFWGGDIDETPLEEDIPDEWNGYFSAIVAVDPTTGKVVWRDWIESARPDVRFLWGGTMSTSTGLLFAGDQHGNMLAYDGETGERLWEYKVGNKMLAGDPVTWYDPETEKQYIAIQVGGSGYYLRGPRGNRLVVFSLEK